METFAEDSFIAWKNYITISEESVSTCHGLRVCESANNNGISHGNIRRHYRTSFDADPLTSFQYTSAQNHSFLPSSKRIHGLIPGNKMEYNATFTQIFDTFRIIEFPTIQINISSNE